MVGLEHGEVEVRDSDPLPLMERVEAAYVERFGDDPEDKGGWYEPDGWRRISRVFERLERGGDVLDVGTGAGQFVNCLALSGEFRSVTTVDPTRFNKYIELSDDIRRHDVSIAALDFDDDSFDVVTCMEVLEHLPSEIFEPAIAELRRVCRGQLIMTVPYREPEPISRSHVRRFEDPDFLELFPAAEFTLLRRPRKPWMLMEERPDTRVFRVVTELRDENARLRAKGDELAARIEALRARRAIRVADGVGREARRARDRVVSFVEDRAARDR